MKLITSLTLVILVAFFQQISAASSFDSNEFELTGQAASLDVPVYRFWGDSSRSHFYTAHEGEFVDLVNQQLNQRVNHWQFEMVAFGVGRYSRTQGCRDGLTPIYRFWSDSKGTHFYTASASEKASVERNFPSHIWRYEFPAFCASAKPSSGLAPVYRFWSDSFQSHFYTVSRWERDNIRSGPLSRTWNYEGIAFYVNGSYEGSRSTQVADSCPVTTRRCIPCNSSHPACRIEDGRSTGFLGWACQNNNPGNIRYSSFRNSLIEAQGVEGACGARGNSQMGSYMVFRTPLQGRNALKAYLTSIAEDRHSAYREGSIRCGDCSLRFFFSKYAPAGDQNNPNSYANRVASELGVSADSATLNWVVENRLDDFVDAITLVEGWFEE